MERNGYDMGQIIRRGFSKISIVNPSSNSSTLRHSVTGHDKRHRERERETKNSGEGNQSLGFKYKSRPGVSSRCLDKFRQFKV